MTAAKEAVVYRVYDADDRLIYIGCSQNLEQRMSNHRNQSWWIYLAARVESQAYSDLAAARQAEAAAIQAEKPAFNLQHAKRPDPMPLAPIELAACRAWLSRSSSRAGFLPIRLRWVAIPDANAA